MAKSTWNDKLLYNKVIQPWLLTRISPLNSTFLTQEYAGKGQGGRGRGRGRGFEGWGEEGYYLQGFEMNEEFCQKHSSKFSEPFLSDIYALSLKEGTTLTNLLTFWVRFGRWQFSFCWRHHFSSALTSLFIHLLLFPGTVFVPSIFANTSTSFFIPYLKKEKLNGILSSSWICTPVQTKFLLRGFTYCLTYASL